MASKKVLTLCLEALNALTRVVESLIEEETAREGKAVSETMIVTEAPSAVESASVVLEDLPPVVTIVEAAQNEPAIEIKEPESTFLPTPFTALPEVVRAAPEIDIAAWERETEEVLFRGNFYEMGNLKTQLEGLGLDELAQKVSDEFTRKNIWQAQDLLEDRDNTLHQLMDALDSDNLEVARSIFNVDVCRVGERFTKLNKRVWPHVENIVNEEHADMPKTFGIIKSEFFMKAKEADDRIKELERAAEAREQKQIEEALAGNIDKKAAKEARRLRYGIVAHLANGNTDAARSQLRDLTSEKNRLAAIAEFRSVKAYRDFIQEKSAAVETSPSNRAKGRRRDLQSV